jgi:hypothetical protein
MAILLALAQAIIETQIKAISTKVLFCKLNSGFKVLFIIVFMLNSSYKCNIVYLTNLKLKIHLLLRILIFFLVCCFVCVVHLEFVD